MPKLSKIIKEFHGGLNSHAERRDVAKNELTEANDLQVDKIGKVTCMSSNIAATGGIVNKAITAIEAGYGLMHFQHDYAGMGYPYTNNIGLQSATAIPTSYTILASPASDQRVYIYGHPQDGETVGLELITLQANRDFSGSTNWINGTDALSDVYGFAGTGSSINMVGDLSLDSGPGTGIYLVYLPKAQAPMTVGASYKLSFDVSGIAGGYTVEDENGSAIGSFSSNGTKEFSFAAASGGGIYIKNNGTVNGSVNLDNFSLVEDRWSQSFDLGSENNFKMIGFVVDGALRIHDANFNNSYTPKWFGFLKRDYFSASELFEGWYSESSIYTSPSVTGSNNASPTQVTGKFNHTTASSNAPLGSISIGFTEGSGGFASGTWDFTNDNYLFYVSYIYEGGYDSPLVYLVDSNKLTTVTGDNKQLVIRVSCKTSGLDTWFNEHSPRIIGFRLYFKQDVSYWTQPSEAWCLQENYFSKDRGSRPPMGGAWREWISSAGDNENTYLTFDAPPEIISYQDINGFSSDDITSAQFKASCVANRKTYIGNIKQGGVVYGDMMIKSPVNGFDLFPKSRSLEVAVADGDEIVQLEEYADRILQFKKGKMHLINVSQEIEFLEDTFVHKGVSNPNATCKTDFGVAWVNKHGCYLYDGKQVTNLIERKNVKLIDEDDWSAHVGERSIIEYIPKKRQLMVIKDYSSAASGKNIYLFDMVTQSWVTSDNAIVSADVDMTNTVIDKNGDLMWAYRSGTDATFRKWSTTPVAQSNFILKTRAFAFGNPSQRKKIYKVYITHKNAGTNQLGLYGEFHSQKAVADQGAGEVSNDFFFGYLTPDVSSGGQTGNFIQQEFSAPSTDLSGSSINFNSVYTLRLYILSNKVWSPNTELGGNLTGTAPSGFEINDITIVYRLKSVK